MAKVLTEVDTFSATVTVPEGGDARNAASVEGAFQVFANRTRNLKNRFDAAEHYYAAYTVAGTSNGLGSPYSLTELKKSGSFALASYLAGHSVQVPQAGTYLVAINLLVTCAGTTNPAGASTAARLLSAAETARFEAIRWSASAAQAFRIVGTQTLTIANPVADRIILHESFSTAITIVAASDSVFSIARIA